MITSLFHPIGACSGLAFLGSFLFAGCQSPPTYISNRASTAPTPPANANQANVAPAAAQAPDAAVAAALAKEPPTTYVFGWGDLPVELSRPRGGVTRGSEITLAAPRTLPAERAGAAARERDRSAILALVGDYRVGFHFMEAVGLTDGYQPTRPYHSWATERVSVLEDRPGFISLQHTLVMFFQQPDGTPSKAAVMKHWRQDWTYEDGNLHEFRGEGTWARLKPSAAERQGAWSQAVFQVDDSPRYEALGRWEHRGNLSVWTGERTWRPLPRRESSVRKDYGVMEGVHRIVLTPTGWLHEQQNWKRVGGDAAGEPARYVGQEYGLDRYERIESPTLEAADDYWKKTGPYWAVVRKGWADAMARHDHFTLSPEKEGEKLFEVFFGYADKLDGGKPFDVADAERNVRETIGRFLTGIPSKR